MATKKSIANYKIMSGYWQLLHKITDANPIPIHYMTSMNETTVTYTGAGVV